MPPRLTRCIRGWIREIDKWVGITALAGTAFPMCESVGARLGLSVNCQELVKKTSQKIRYRTLESTRKDIKLSHVHSPLINLPQSNP